MIAKGMDVKELMSSDLLYPPIWTNQTIFSENLNLSICTYNGTIDNLENEDPMILFGQKKEKINKKKDQKQAADTGSETNKRNCF
jgi:hypothetical protein